MPSSKLSYQKRAASCPSIMGKNILTLLDDKQTNLAVSADVTSADKLLQLADLLGPEIAVFKTHIDIIADFTPRLTTELKKLAQKHRFFIFEDRKFADIGNTVKHQYEGGIYQIAKWADIINAHTLPGPGIIKALDATDKPQHSGLLLIAEMSSEGHLLNPAYQQKTLEMAEAHKHFVIGIIAQHAISSDPDWIYMSPGINMGSTGDALGQQYNTPEKAILENGTDIIIVGRGIIEAADPLSEAKRYRQHGWDAYQKRLSQS